MPEHPRRPPPGKSFPFLRKGDGQRTKIKYPVLKRAENFSKSVIGSEEREIFSEQDEHDTHRRGTNFSMCPVSNTSEISKDYSGHCNFQSIVDRNPDIESEKRESSSNDNGNLSSSQEESATPSSIAQSNIELRKQNALPLQKWARDGDYSLPIHNAESSSPVLASTPNFLSQRNFNAVQHSSKMQPSQTPQHIVPLETSILGDVTNQKQTDDASSPSRCEKRNFSHFHDGSISNIDYAPKSQISANDAFTSNKHGEARSDPVAYDKTESFRQKGYVDVEMKLVEQLRNAIAHLDLADVELQRKAIDLEEAYNKFSEDLREFEEQKKIEKERVQRVRRQLERERRLVNKDDAERDKAFAEQIEELMKVVGQKDRQISSLRLRLRKSEEQEQAKQKDLEDSNKKIERLERNVNILQRQLAQVRGNYAKQSQEMAAELQASRTHNLRRNRSVGLLQSGSDQISLGKDTVADVPQVPDISNAPRENSAQEYSKCVSWADKNEHVDNSNRTIPSRDTSQLKFSEEGAGYFGLCRLFKNEVGDWTKITTTDCGCDLYEYSNSDVRWICCDRTVEVNYFGIVGATVVTLIKGCSIRYFNNGQVEIYRLSGEISRFDPATKRRTETMLCSDGSKYVEIFDSSGCFQRFGANSWTSHSFSERSSYRGYPSDRHVYNHNNVEPEWIEPEYNARRCPDGSLKIKLASVMICCIGVEDVGYVKHTTRLENGSERKRMCVEWGHVARARQRQIEARKCQQLITLNATM